MAKYSTLFYFFLVLHQIINIDCCNITWAKNRACHLIFLLLLLKCIQQLLESTYVNCTEIRELPLLRINALPRTTFATTRKRTSVRTARVAGHYPLTPQSLLTTLRPLLCPKSTPFPMGLCAHGRVESKVQQSRYR